MKRNLCLPRLLPPNLLPLLSLHTRQFHCFLIDVICIIISPRKTFQNKDCRSNGQISSFFPFTQHSLSINLVTSLAANNYQLQCDLIRNGVLWSLLLFMFDYDYTLEESGVETEEKSNKQVSQANHVEIEFHLAAFA